MGDTFAIAALRRKRAHLAGEIEAAQKALTAKRDTLATLDAVILLFEPEGRPDLIPAIRPVSRRCMWFKRGEQPRLCLSALREAGKPIQAQDVVTRVLAAKGLDVDARVRKKIAENVRTTLTRMEAKGVVRKVVQWPDVWWELASD